LGVCVSRGRQQETNIPVPQKGRRQTDGRTSEAADDLTDEQPELPVSQHHDAVAAGEQPLLDNTARRSERLREHSGFVVDGRRHSVEVPQW
jgi:hypothetical protein